MKSFVVILSLFLVSIGNSYGQKPVERPEDRPEFQKHSVKFYPNPATNFITFEFKEPLERGTQLQIFSFLGRQVSSIPVQSQRVTINLTEYSRGIYVFQLRTPSGKVSDTNKFQVNR